MTDPKPSLREQLTEPLVEDRDAVFATPLKQQVEHERRKAVLLSFLWRAAVAAAIGLGTVGIGVGAIHLARLVTTAMGG